MTLAGQQEVGNAERFGKGGECQFDQTYNEGPMSTSSISIGIAAATAVFVEGGYVYATMTGPDGSYRLRLQKSFDYTVGFRCARSVADE